MGEAGRLSKVFLGELFSMSSARSRNSSGALYNEEMSVRERRRDIINTLQKDVVEEVQESTVFTV